MPEKSGVDAARCVALAGACVCPKAGIEAAPACRFRPIADSIPVIADSFS
jgi:hypothetical protein